MVISSATLFMEGKAGSTAPHRALGHHPEDAKDRLFILHGKCSTVFLCIRHSNGISVPESLIFFIACHTAASHHVVRGPCGEAHLPLSDVDLAHLTCVRSVERPLTPPCLCQAGFPVSGRPRWRVSCPRARGCGSQELNSGTNPEDLAEKVNSGTNLGDLAEKVNSGTNLGDLTEKVNSGINPGNLAERVNSGINPGDLAEKVNSSTNSGDVAEKVNFGTNPRDLTEKVNSGTNPGDLTEKSVSFEQVGMTSSSSSSSVRVISSPGSGGASQGDPEANSKGVSSGPPSLVDVRVLRDLEVMKADHDLDTAVTEGSLAVIRGRYSIPAEYGLHAPRPGQRPYMVGGTGGRDYLVVFLGESRGVGIIPTRDLFMACFRLCKSRGGYYLTARVDFWVSRAPSNNKGWKSRYLFVSGPVWGFRLDWSAHPIGNASPYLSEEEFVLIGRLKGILSSSCAIKEMTELWLVKAGPSTRAAAPAREVGVSPVREAPKTSSKRPIDALTEQADDPARRHKKVKMLTRRHKSRHSEGESRSHSKGKEPATPSEEPDTPAESDEGDASSVHHRLRSMKGLFKTKVQKGDAGYYTLQMSDLGHQDPDKEMKARWRGLKNSTEELYMLPSKVLLARAAKEMVLVSSRPLSQPGTRCPKVWRGPEAVAKAEERASELEQELEKTKRERDEALQRLEASEKELNEVRSNLAEIQRLLKEARVRARKMDDELLQAVKALENARVELPRQAIDHYKESADFKEGLKGWAASPTSTGIGWRWPASMPYTRTRRLRRTPSPSIPRTIWCRWRGSRHSTIQTRPSPDFVI
ncbi:hypothetical protein B296_00034446 [Ensete ventricosum]|uniref:Uncharacterized protein n=1 Tax=Ensete ventricosum TaxID=4639 RepID=A0A426WWH3_ENSVE|nr:hypothetical protein B296_00034446 [Ensete ventricosum]